MMEISYVPGNTAIIILTRVELGYITRAIKLYTNQIEHMLDRGIDEDVEWFFNIRKVMQELNKLHE